MQTEKKKETARVIKFVLFSASAGIIETLAMILCEEILKIPAHWLCYAIALVLSVLWNFTFNRKFTFQSAANVPRAMLLVFFSMCPSRRSPFGMSIFWRTPTAGTSTPFWPSTWL